MRGHLTPVGHWCDLHQGVEGNLGILLLLISFTTINVFSFLFYFSQLFIKNPSSIVCKLCKLMFIIVPVIYENNSKKDNDNRIVSVRIMIIG